jgi:Plasmid encoded RepA protein
MHHADALRQHPVPLRETALRSLASKSVSLDIYIWLAYRLHTLEKPTPIRWAALLNQFGANYGRPRSFRENFTKALAPAVAAYPEAHITLADEGLVLHPSRSPVAPRMIAVGRQ